MFYWVKLHHWKYGEKEENCYTKEQIHSLVDMHLDAGWVVIRIETRNGNQKC